MLTAQEAKKLVEKHKENHEKELQNQAKNCVSLILKKIEGLAEHGASYCKLEDKDLSLSNFFEHKTVPFSLKPLGVMVQSELEELGYTVNASPMSWSFKISW